MRGDANGRTWWDRKAKHYDRSMALLGGPLPRMVSLAEDAVRGVPSVLEVAAGTGLVTLALSRSARQVVATDYAPAMVAQLEQRVRSAGLTNVRCEQADLYALPFPEGTFDAVVAANVLHLLPDVPGALAALRRVLKPGGRLVAPTYCHDETVTARVVSRALGLLGFPGQRRYSARTLRDALVRGGVGVTRVEVIRGLLPIAWIEGTFDARPVTEP